MRRVHPVCQAAHDHEGFSVAEYPDPYPGPTNRYDVIDGDGETVISCRSRADADAVVAALTALARRCDELPGAAFVATLAGSVQPPAERERWNYSGLQKASEALRQFNQACEIAALAAREMIMVAQGFPTAGAPAGPEEGDAEEDLPNPCVACSRCGDVSGGAHMCDPASPAALQPPAERCKVCNQLMSQHPRGVTCRFLATDEGGARVCARCNGARVVSLPALQGKEIPCPACNRAQL